MRKPPERVLPSRLYYNQSYLPYYKRKIVTNFSLLIDPTTTAKGLKGGEHGQTYDKGGCSTVVTILASLVAVTSAALLIFAVCFYSWQKKQRKGELLSSLHVYVYIYI